MDITNLNMIAERDPTSLKAWATSQPLHLAISRAVPNESRAEQDARIVQSEIEELSTPYEIYNGTLSLHDRSALRQEPTNLPRHDRGRDDNLIEEERHHSAKPSAQSPASGRRRLFGVQSRGRVRNGQVRPDGHTGRLVHAGQSNSESPCPAQISGGRRTYRVLACIATDSDSTQKLAPRMGWTWGYLRDSYYGPYYHIPDLPEADDGLFKDAGEYAEPPKIINEGEWTLVELGQIEHRSRLPYAYTFRGVAIVPLFYFDDQAGEHGHSVPPHDLAAQ